MRGTSWRLTVVAAALLAACMPTSEPTSEPASGPTSGSASATEDGPARLSDAEVAAANDEAGCVAFDERTGSLSARHVGEDAPPAAELYEDRPPTAGDHLGAWVDARVYADAPDERAVVHNHEHGAVSVWYDADRLATDAQEALVAWAEARNAELANDAGAGVLVAPFADGLPDDAAISFRAWTGGLDCRAFDRTVADGFLLERFGQAPEGSLAPALEGVVDRATAA